MNNKCLTCGTPMKGTRENIKDDLIGLDGVTLKGVMVYRCLKCGERLLGIHKIVEMHRQLAMAVARRREKLGPKEIRFLRKYLGLSSKDFADKMGVDKTTVSKWERVDAPAPMGQPAERLLCLMVMVDKPVEEYPLEETGLVEARPLRMVLEEGKGSQAWRVVPSS
ncbi:type II TA system antitoxin MqsA family protein [Archangium gephyra]|uniref:type II TA system antitoxin MqsA family protein n=1 Tax=Archangium gephyra TaxID=48 RepID=UPI003B9835A5